MSRLEESRPKEERGESMLRDVERIKDKIIYIYGEEHYRRLVAKIKSGYFGEADRVVDEPAQPEKEGSFFGVRFYEVAEAIFHYFMIFVIFSIVGGCFVVAFVIPVIKFFLSL